MGNGLTVWDNSREKHGDYLIVAHISDSGKISWRNEKLKPGQQKQIEAIAAKHKEDMRPKFREVKVFFENGDHLQTSMAEGLTDEQILEYYAIGKVFNLGVVDDLLAKVKRVEIIY